jgi:ferredoxin
MACLTELRDILRQSPRASLLSLSLQSHSEPGAVEAMMRVWEQKGRVKRTAPSPSACGGCGGCVAGCSPSQIIFEWLGD